MHEWSIEMQSMITVKEIAHLCVLVSKFLMRKKKKKRRFCSSFSIFCSRSLHFQFQHNQLSHGLQSFLFFSEVSGETARVTAGPTLLQKLLIASFSTAGTVGFILDRGFLQAGPFSTPQLGHPHSQSCVSAGDSVRYSDAPCWEHAMKKKKREIT